MSLEKRLQEVMAAPVFEERCRIARERPGGMTSFYEQAAIVSLIHLLPGARAVEIGTAFAHTSRLMAEAIVESGGRSFVTVDPFGAERAPRLIAEWPQPLQAVTQFVCKSSMDFFLDVELQGSQSGRDAPFDLVFVDGHHSFEYAFFDVMRAAFFLKPGGAIVIDNIDQSGPAAAVAAFLSYFRRWTDFRRTGHDAAAPDFMAGGGGAILLAPEGLEIGALPLKIDLKGLTHERISELRVPLVDSAAGTLHVSCNFYSRAPDYHLTGKGIATCVRNHSVETRGGQEAVVRFEDPAELRKPCADADLQAQIEFSFTSAEGQNLLMAIDRDVVALP